MASGQVSSRKRRPRALGLVALLVFALLAGYARPALAADWPGYGRGPDHLGAVDDLLGSVLLQRWTTAPGPQAQGDPVVVGGTVFAGADDRVFRALDVKDGGVKWTFNPAGLPRSAPAVSDDAVYLIDFSGNGYALRATDGLLLWQAALGDRGGATPVLGDGVLFVAGAQGVVQAFDAASGAAKWRSDVGLPIWSTPAYGSGFLYVEDYSGGVHALDARDGHQVWGYQTSGELRMSPALYGQKLIVASSGYEAGGIVALDALTGAVLWTRSISGNNLWSAPAVARTADGRPLVLAGNLGWLYAIDADTGAVVWSNHMTPIKYAGRTKYPTMMTPVVGRDHVYVGAYYAVDAPSCVYSFNLSDGRLLWTSPVAGKIATPLAYADGSVYFGSYDGRVYAYAPIRVFIGGKPVDFGDLSPVVRSNRSLVPFRALFEALEAEVTWDQAAQRVTARLGDRLIRLTVGSTEAMVDGRLVTLEVAPAIINERTLVPLRFIAEALGKLDWDQAGLRVDVTLPDATH
ncbi:MAG: outer membrane protein assembly factor BamB family protein [Bacillota bacterium]